jgi:S-adenosylmethionine:tRNA ribosyltransferase-isomerase
MHFDERVMRLSEFEFDLPEELIAQAPPKNRGDSRLMVVSRSTRALIHSEFRALPEHLKPSDLLVLNQSAVFPARLFGRRSGRDERIEVLLLREIAPARWEVLSRPARKLQPGAVVEFGRAELTGTVEELASAGKRVLSFQPEDRFWDLVEMLGEVPLPPYIRRPEGKTTQEDRKRYQTVYARRKGSVAAPTAGLHFTPELLQKVQHCFVTLHVGYGTFRPVTSDRIERHEMDPEWFSISAETARRIRNHRQGGGRIVAVGSTSARVLEHLAIQSQEPHAMEGWTSLFIRPGFQFQAVDALITNFHLPRSSLLMLASAFAGRELLQKAYREAIRLQYRFYSYGDAMLIV